MTLDSDLSLGSTGHSRVDWASIRKRQNVPQRSQVEFSRKSIQAGAGISVSRRNEIKARGTSLSLGRVPAHTALACEPGVLWPGYETALLDYERLNAPAQVC